MTFIIWHTLPVCHYLAITCFPDDNDISELLAINYALSSTVANKEEVVQYVTIFSPFEDASAFDE